MYMKSFVINLKRDTKKKETFLKNNSQYLPGLKVCEAVEGRKVTHKKLLSMGLDTDKHWRDPLLERTLTHGEVGCFLSHYALWKQCAAGTEHFLILEDDVVITSELPDDLEEKTGDGLLYLLWNEMRKAGAKQGKPCYPYWTCAYVLSPHAAQVLVDNSLQIIPVDEFLAFVSDRVSLRSHTDHGLKLQSKGSATEPSSHKDYFIDFQTHVLTVASDESKARKLFESAEQQGIDVTNIWPEDKEWEGGLINYSTGGGVKLNLLREHIKDLPGQDLVVFTDAYDVFYADNLDTIIRRYLSFKTEVIAQAESSNWPDKNSIWPPSHTPYRYLCSGVIIGRVRELRKMLTADLREAQSDQLYLQQLYLQGHYNIKLDHEMYIVSSSEDAVSISNRQLYNNKTNCFSCIYHGNGGPQQKDKFEEMYRKLYPKRNYLQIPGYKIIGNEMLLIDYKTPEQCQEWIDIAEEHGGWNPHPADAFPSHDIHLKELGLMEEADDFFRVVVKPIIEKHWRPMLHTHLRKAFAMKYSPDTQKTLGLHNDSSQVTGSVKLNDDYEGATLYWPRQGINNDDIPVGKMVLFPGMVTHGHYVDELKSGTKYSATFWTARFKGEYL